MIHHRTWDSLAKHAALEIIDRGAEVDLWAVYEGLYRFFMGGDDPAESSADFCWTQNVVYELEDRGLIWQDAEDYFHYAPT